MQSMTATDHAFELFLALTCRDRMSPDEKRIYDWHKAQSPEGQIAAYAANKRKRAS